MAKYLVSASKARDPNRRSVSRKFVEAQKNSGTLTHLFSNAHNLLPDQIINTSQAQRLVRSQLFSQAQPAHLTALQVHTNSTSYPSKKNYKQMRLQSITDCLSALCSTYCKKNRRGDRTEVRDLKCSSLSELNQALQKQKQCCSPQRRRLVLGTQVPRQAKKKRSMACLPS